MRVPFKRRREQATNYKKRLALIKSGKPRLVIRLSNKYINCQLVKYETAGDITLAGFNSKSLSKFGFKGSKNLQSAYLTGYVIGLKAKGKKAIVDLGLQSSVKNSRVFACVKGALEAGLKVPCSEEVLPSDELLKKDELKKVVNKLEGEFK